MMIFQSAPPPPRLSFAEAPLLYLAVALCVVTVLVAALQTHRLLEESRQYRIDARPKWRNPSAWPWTSAEYVLNPANYQPGTARPIIRRYLVLIAVQGLAGLAALFIAFAFIL
jgi:hypothetical protein